MLTLRLSRQTIDTFSRSPSALTSVEERSFDMLRYRVRSDHHPWNLPWATWVLLAFAVLVPPQLLEASSLTVPDDVSTLQQALDAQVDTVFLRSGSYSETPIVRWPVRLQGLPGTVAPERPYLDGLTLSPAPYLPSLTTFGVSGIDIGGPVYIQNDDVACLVDFRDCALLAGIEDLSGYLATGAVALRGCRAVGNLRVRVDGSLTLDSCLVEGGVVVGDGDADLVVIDSEFSGDGSGTAIAGRGGITSAFISHSYFHDYVYGVELPNLDFGAVVRDNQITNCLGRGIDVGPNNVIIERNRISGCSNGAIGVAYEHAVVADNLVSGCSVGLFLYVDSGSVERNTVWFCGGDGIRVSSYYPQDLLVANNTSCFNGGSGLTSYVVYDGDHYEVVRNIGYRNAEYGMRWLTPRVTEVACNDWFGNGLGQTSGREPSPLDFGEEPMFCDTVAGDFHLSTASPLVSWMACGRVGAQAEGCGVTATLLKSFSAERVSEGVRLVWELAAGAAGSEAWLERSEWSASGSWTQVVTERSSEGGAFVELDRTALPEQRYWYRLVVQEAGVLGSPLMVDAATRPIFAITRVTPNPAQGPVRVEFSMESAATIVMEIFDLQGRCVASPATGRWPAGQQAVEWNGLTDAGAQTPPGIYLLRFRHPGGQQVRRIVRSS